MRPVASLLIAAAALMASSCLHAQAKTPGPAPAALAIPEPPPRLQIPVDPDPPAPPPSTTDKPATATTTTPTTNKPKPTPPPAPTPVAPPPATAPPDTPPQPVVTAGNAAYELRAQNLLADAQRNLARVNREKLGPSARSQYDSAQQFVQYAKQALKQRNFPFAASCADKAATLAALLVKD